MISPKELERAAELLLAARYTVAFTGAGISTPSGIPDYRSPGTGLWQRMDAMKVASLRAFRADPEAFYRTLRPLVRNVLAAEPNAAHRSLATLERWGLLASIITQNIDNLHQQAGSQRVWEIHGRLGQARCTRCNRDYPANGMLGRYIEREEMPRCACCGMVLKPDVVLFGEPLPRYVFLEASGEAERCDLMLVIGASLQVAPASDLPLLALRRGARIILINSTPTPLDDQAAVLFRDDLAEVLPQLAERCRLRLGLTRPGSNG